MSDTTPPVSVMLRLDETMTLDAGMVRKKLFPKLEEFRNYIPIRHDVVYTDFIIEIEKILAQCDVSKECVTQTYTINLPAELSAELSEDINDSEGTQNSYLKLDDDAFVQGKQIKRWFNEEVNRLREMTEHMLALHAVSREELKGTPT